MADDPLSSEVAVSAELLPSGIKAAAKSRLISAVDRLGGNLVQLLNAPIDRRLERDRAVAKADVKLIERLGDLRLEQLHQNPEFAAKALEQHFKIVVRRQTNKAAVVKLALEDLREEPPTADQETAGPDELTGSFLDRFERYAEDATADDVRERWGKVLASEIKKPGTFSGRVMRVIDEIDTETAILFARICGARIQNYLIPTLMGEISYVEQTRLVSAELLVDVGLGGQLLTATPTTMSGGMDILIIVLGVGAIGFKPGAAIPKKGVQLEPGKFPIGSDGGKPTLPVYLLTDVGHAISSIIPHDEAAVLDRLVSMIADHVQPTEVFDFRPGPDAGTLKLVKTWNGEKAVDSMAHD